MVLLKNLSHTWTLARVDLQTLYYLCTLQAREGLHQLSQTLTGYVNSCKCLTTATSFAKAYLALLQDEDYLDD